MGFLADKKILITGLLSKHSIAYVFRKITNIFCTI